MAEVPTNGARWSLLWILPVVVAALAAAVAAVLVLTGALGSGDVNQSKPDTSAVQGREVAAALKGLGARPQDLVSTASRHAVGGDAAVAVPPGTRVEVDPKSWAPAGPDFGTILVTLTGSDGKSETYQTVMLQEAGHWKVVGTMPVDDAGSAGR